MPDENCLFSAICVAGKLEMDCFDLRSATVDYIAGNMNDFHKFMLAEQGDTMVDSATIMGEEFQMMKYGSSWVGYESIMAISRHLGAVILVTSGGTSDKDNVRTDLFYYGEERPEKRIHIVWVSAGFYDAVVPITGAAGSQVFAPRRPVEVNLLQENGRLPSHVCQCKWMCDCKRWHGTHTFPEDYVEQSSQAEVAQGNCRSLSPDSFWDEVFHYLCKQAPVLSKWKFIMRWLKLGEDRIAEINEKTSLHDKVDDAFRAWRQESKSAVTIVALQKALRKENLNLVAGTIVFIMTHFVPLRRRQRTSELSCILFPSKYMDREVTEPDHLLTDLVLLSKISVIYMSMCCYIPYRQTKETITTFNAFKLEVNSTIIYYHYVLVA